MKVNTQAYLKQLEDQLLKEDRISMNFERNWPEHFVPKAGVYTVFDQNKLIYIGETGNLKGRMKDIRRTVNHSFRRSLGTKLYSNYENYQAATSRKKFALMIEQMLTDYCTENISIAAITVDLGRKELEEYMLDRLDNLLNSRKKRK